jgi:hypothetical protein
MAEENKFVLDVDVAPLKTQLRNAVKELQGARQKYGEFSEEAVNAANKVATIKDEIEDANEQAQLFDPGKRFQALTTAATTAAAGVTAVQGAMALFGDESEDVAKTLAKVQGALALSQGLSQLKDIGKVGQQLKGTFAGLTAGANGFKKALISTGIGALVVAVGLLVAYWEDIKGLVNGVSGEQQKLNEESEANLKTQEEKLDAIDGQSNQLKLQGKSEKEILQLKIKQSDEAIKAAEINLQNAKTTKDAQVEAAKRNKDILQGLIRLVTIPITAVLAGIDKIGQAIGQDLNLEEQFSGGLANLVFNPEEVAKEGDEAIKKAENTINTLKEKRAGYQISVQNIDNEASNKATERANKQREKEIEAEKILQEAKTKLLSKQKQEEEAVEQAYAEKFKKLAEAGMKDDGSLEKAKQKELDEIKDNYRKEEEEKVKLYEKQLANIRTEIRLAGIKDENERAKAEIRANYENERMLIDENEKLTSAQKIELKAALKEQEDLALRSVDQKLKEQQIADRITEVDNAIKNAENDFQLQKELTEKKKGLYKEQLDAGIISQSQYTEFLRQNADEQKAIDKATLEAKMQVADQVAGILSSMSSLAGKDTAAGKALGIASATINTFTGATRALNSFVPLPEPAATVVRIAQAGVIVASGIKSIREIAKAKVPSGSGSSASIPSGGVSAPSVAQALPTLGTSPLTSVEKLFNNQKPLKAYVVESEVTGTQKRVSDIERRAGF